MEGSDSVKACRRCGRRLEVGMDALAVEPCVVGTRSIVPLDEPRLYCDESCLRHERDGGPVIRRLRRIP